MMSLYKSALNREYRITHVPELGILKGLGVRKGTRLQPVHRYFLGGPVLVIVDGAYSVALGKDAALQIQVEGL
jgi:Fe2+ transport system protein FeoA